MKRILFLSLFFTFSVANFFAKEIPIEKDLYEYVRLEDIEQLNKAAGLERIQIISAE